MPENTLVSPFLSAFMTIIFFFSTLYTAAYYFNQGMSTQLSTSGINDNPPPIGSVALSVVDPILEASSLFAPFGLVKILIFEVMSSTPEIYTFINLLVLRPVSWIVSLFTINYLVSKIPTMSGEV